MRLRRFVFLLALFCLGALLGLFGPWVWWLDREAGQRFSERQWTQASRVYARPLEIYPGRSMDRQRLTREFKSIGLREGDPGMIGRYRSTAAQVEANIPGFVFAEGRQASQRIVVGFGQNQKQIDRVASGDGRSISLVRLPPAELGSLLPLDDRDRTLVALRDFPPLLIAGIQAVEDRQFAHHLGVDPRGLLRAAWTNLRRGAVVQGGSTITQQLVKNLFLTPERSLLRKFNEAVMAVSLERRFGKAAILEAYLNEVYLGQAGNRAIHGFGRAAEHYFGLPVQALNTEQTALLIGMVRGASWYHPRRNPERARDRRDRVIDIFYETGLIDEAERQRARSIELDLGEPRRTASRRHDGFLDLVARQLRLDYRDRDLRGTGLRIFTTLDPVAQEDAERALTESLTATERSDGELQGAIVLVEPASGEIRALVGDRSPGRFGFNRALDARRPIGSVIKPFIYLLALAQPDRWNLVSTLIDAPLSVPVDGQQAWRPENIDGVSHGEVALMDALGRSFNQATVALGLEVGLPALFRLLEQLGIHEPGEPHPSALLGAVEMTPLQVAQLYQPLAAEGYSTPLRAINQVLDREGREIARYDRRLRPVREREALALLDFALRHAVTDGTGRSLSWRLATDPGVRGKTGTSNDRRDAWFVGYTDDWLGVVWAGRDDNAPAGVSGSATALPVWAELFNRLPLSTVRRNWPEGIEWYWIDWPAPLLASEQCPDALAVPFISGSQPESLSPCLGEANESPRRWFRRR
ncbi:MAG: penicillin-binding protein 1B [Wenzhouxiangella sp.]|jgi:penicillin-binding protein 1B|nr:penicillin-binding protein 1B [Wenzhouxiangella sp.]